jgi:hypothetical protein
VRGGHPARSRAPVTRRSPAEEAGHHLVVLVVLAIAPAAWGDGFARGERSRRRRSGRRGHRGRARLRLRVRRVRRVRRGRRVVSLRRGGARPAEVCRTEARPVGVAGTTRVGRPAKLAGPSGPPKSAWPE